MLTANWSELPSDILRYLINLLPLPDYHRFGVVCQNWCRVVRKKQHPAQQLPWLVLGEDIATKKHVFFNLSENKHYYMNIPELHRQFVCGSSYNWLFTVDIAFNIRMLNLFTRKSYDLPPLKFTYDELTIEYWKHDLVYKVIMDHDPNERSDFTVMVIGSYYQKVAFWKQGDSTWTLPIFHNGAVNDIIFFKEKFYALVEYIRSDQIFTIDVGPDSKLVPLQHRVPMIRKSYKYLVDFKGELLLIQRNREDPKRILADRGLARIIPNVIVNKLDLEEGTYFECKHINNHAFFIGKNSPVVIDPAKFSGCIKNAIYFTHTISDIYLLGRRDLETYNMATKSLARYYQFEYFSPLFVSPTWLAPNI